MIQTKEIPGFPGYFADTDGALWSERRGTRRRLKYATLKKLPYQMARLYQNSVSCHVLVHRIILLTFVGPCPPGMWCRHLDGNPRNNALENLQWNTVSENLRDRKRHGWDNSGENNAAAKLTNAQVLELRQARSAGSRLKDLAKKYGISFQSVSRVARGDGWKEILEVTPTGEPVAPFAVKDKEGGPCR